ncbi:TetR/AcrR family transcriptional regulator [Sphingobium sp.]|uniref:TetR/AcrR family transcriptional regulator n=1 Tax=Sphingobium sp. TaxID=1912891 RepID=UPI002B897E8D|nr:TetR/AcrR family transcriptional regulator [Sphingobium sp.]HUD93994.1 TetR/AcrR family transcriptional regulator [Sphingobium sp.]
MKRTNKQGQALGRKGEESRRKLMDAVLSLLATEPVHKLSASRIARAASMASQSFYLYFKDIDEILCVLAEEAAADVDELVALLRSASQSTAPETLSRNLIDAHAAYWDRHRSILSARNYIADSGNRTFLRLRQEATMPVVYAMADRIQAAQPDRLTRAASVSRAVVIYLAMERLAARSNATQYKAEDADKDDLRQGEIDILSLLFTPAAGPA